MGHRYYTIKDKAIEKMDVRLLSISQSKDEKDWQSLFHTHPFTELFYVASGSGVFVLPDREFDISTGDFIIIPPYTEHTERSHAETPLEYYVLGIDGISFQSDREDLSAYLIRNFGSSPYIAELFCYMIYEARNEEYGSDSICHHLLEILILRILRNNKLVAVPSNAMRMTKECARIKEYLDTNYSEHITLNTLTELTHMNKYYLVHSFTKYTGLSPIQYLNERRLKTACMLLRETDFSVSEISSSTGFSSQSYFTQSFRKKYGVTPVKYRQLHGDSAKTAPPEQTKSDTDAPKQSS